MPRGGGMNLIPKQIFVRVDVRALRAIADVNKSVVFGVGRQPVEKAVNVETIEGDGDSISLERTHGRVQLLIKLVAILRGSGVKGAGAVSIILVVGNEPERRNVRHKNRNRTGAGQTINQSPHPLGGRDYVVRAVVVKEIVAAAPDNKKRGRI